MLKSDPKNFSTESLEALDFLGFGFATDWPLEIIFDNHSIEKYNTIFSFLLRIRRCTYLIQKRDYWVKMAIPKKTEDLNVRDQLVVKNKMAFNSLVHKMQLFQREVHHFINNLEYYMKTKSIQRCCEELDLRLRGMESGGRVDNLYSKDFDDETVTAP